VRNAELTRTLDRSELSSYLYRMQNIIRVLREAKGLSQGELARDMDVSRQTINSIETERYTPSLALAIALAQYFGKTVEEVFGREA
jgi:putative transcriptional regulator